MFEQCKVPMSTYQVILLPRKEVVARGCTLAEANAWMQAYNYAMDGGPPTAVIAEEVIARPVSKVA